MGNELYYMEDGKKKDASLHEEILNSKTADKELSKLAVQRALERYGLSIELAKKLYE